jgi:hypothetical protein
MELLDYLKLRWITFAALFLVGLLVIVVAGAEVPDGTRKATATVIVLPATGELSTYSNDVDRYVNTKLQLVSVPAFQDAVAAKAGVKSVEVRHGLHSNYASASGSVSLSASLPDAGASVRVVNAAAAQFVAELKSTSRDPLEEQEKVLKTQATTATKALATQGGVIKRASDAYVAAHPGTNPPDASVLAPDAAAQVTVLNTQLQQITQQSSTLNSAIVSGNPSYVLQLATKAAPAQSWGLTVYLAAVVGLVLLLLAGLATGLALSRRVIGSARWTRATRKSQVRGAITLRQSSKAQRDRSIRRLLLALQEMGHSDGATIVTFLPAPTPRIKKRTAFLLAALQERDDISLEVHDSAGEAVHALTVGGAGQKDHDTAPIILLVDVARADFADVEVVSEFDHEVLERLLPVLV